MSRAVARVGLAGLGTVGQELARALAAGVDGLELVAVSARDRSRVRDFMPQNIDWHDDARALAKRDDIDIIVELIGGSDGVAYDLARDSLMGGKHFVTANKALMAARAVELAELAEKNGVGIGYEAAVAGAIPIIRTLRDALSGQKIDRICGILNGTCNFILSEMFTKGSDFASALAEAQAQGYAEADPSFDIDGVDAAQKLAILSALAWGAPPDTARVHIEGITQIAACDIAFAQELQHTIRLIALAEMEKGLVQQVRPMLVARGTALAQIEGVSNAVLLQSAGAGELILQGAGAGGAATASAVLGDLTDLAGGVVRPFFGDAPRQAKPWQAVELPPTRWYLRLMLHDSSGSMAMVTKILAEANLSIDSVIQRSDKPADSFLPVLFMTHQAEAAAVRAAKQALAGQGDLVKHMTALPVLE